MPDTIQDFCLGGGRVVHKRNGPRIRTVVYTVADGKITYGAEVFRADSKTDHWRRKTANGHALSRYNDAPVTIPDLTPNPRSPLSIGAQRERYVVKMTAQHGVCSD